MEFKYYKNIMETGVFKTDEKVICECCGKETNIYYDGVFYSEEEIEFLCPECISSGLAAEKFDGEFFDDEFIDKVDDEEKIRELLFKTPNYTTETDACWIAHCDDYCQFIGEVTWDYLVEHNLEYVLDELKDVFAEDGIDIGQIKKYLDGESELKGYLFQCIHCKKYEIIITFVE